MKKALLSLLLVTACFASFAQKATGHIPAGSLVYSLPQTIIEVKVDVVEEYFIPGPYAGSSEAYLSIDRVPTMDGVKFHIKNIEISSVLGADYESSYVLPASAIKGGNSSFFDLVSGGLVFTGVKSGENQRTTETAPLDQTRVFPDRLPSSPIETKKTSSYDRVKTDSGFVHIPYQQSIVNEKDPERKAEEAAKFIFSLRQRRFELITGDVENAFAGSSLKDALNEINRLENEYVALFTGKSTNKIKQYKFSIIPEKSSNKTNYNVFRFSEFEGILPGSSKSGRAFTLEVIPSGRIKGIENISYETGKSGTVYYRVPETATVQLMSEGKEVCRSEMQVYQSGKDLGLSIDVLTK